MLLLIALAGGTGAFAYAYTQLRRIRLEGINRAETVARAVARAATAAARLIDLLAEVLRLIATPSGSSIPSSVSRLPSEAGPDCLLVEEDEW